MSGTTKKFSHGGLTHSLAHHLLALDDSVRELGYARAADVARRLELTRASALVSMRSLLDAGYVRRDDNLFFRLTPKGVRAVKSVRVRHKVMERFLTDVLGLPARQAHRESCRAETLIEPQTARRLAALIAFWKARGLAGSLDEPNVPECSARGACDPAECPCCGLECIESELTESSTP